MIFEVFCIDQKGAVAFKDKINFLDALSFNEDLWKSKPQKNEGETSLWDETQNISIKIENIDTSKVVADLFASAFLIKVTGEYLELESFRLRLVTHLRNLKFNHIRILTDDVSTHIAVEIYPLINKIENLLRRYVVKFFTTKIGIGWFEISVPTEVKEKVGKRKDNEPILTKNSLVNTDVTLIDFNEIGEIITRQSSVYSKVDDLIDRIKTATDLEALKTEISGHYPKYFKDIFGKQNFETKWKSIFDIRNKVAHNNYLFQKDLNEANKLYQDLQNIIQEAENKIDEAVFDLTQKEAINKAIVEAVAEQKATSSIAKAEAVEDDNVDIDIPTLRQSESEDNAIKISGILTEDEFMREFEIFDRYKNPNWTFLSLSKFLDYLERRGYNRQVANSVVSILADKGVIRIDYVDNPIGNYPTATIKKVV